jgi:hypothetical protein
VARSLIDPASGQPLASAVLASSNSPPPQQMPHIVVSTPGALVAMMDNVGPAFGFEWTRAGAQSVAAQGSPGRRGTAQGSAGRHSAGRCRAGRRDQGGCFAGAVQGGCRVA